MFTQCSNCHTVFQLSAEVLRAAGGQVRCGRCGEIFSALARLAEDANSFDNGESAYEMEERADSILESVVAEQVAQAIPDTPEEEDFDGTEVAQLQVLDFTEEDLIDESAEDAVEEPETYGDAEMEFTLPPGELDRIFVESKAGVPPSGTSPPFALDYSAAPMSPSPAPIAAAIITLAAPAAVSVAASGAPEPMPADSVPTPTMPLTATLPVTVEDEGPLPDIEVISDNRSSEAARHPLSPLAELGAYDLQDKPVRPAGPFALWVSAAIMAALLLVGQVVHRNRETLTAHGPLAPLLRMVYSSIGAPLNAAPNLAVFQLRQWGVTGDPANEATLRVRASILNTSSQLQPFPLLRVTLANRYGTRIGTRDFDPSEYIGKAIARQLSPGETVDAILNILDPGKDAEGFEIDVCLRGTDKKIVCANDLAPVQPKP